MCIRDRFASGSRISLNGCLDVPRIVPPCVRILSLIHILEEKAIRYIAKAADGSMRDALSLLDQCIAFYLGQKLTYDNVLEVLGAVDTEDVYKRQDHRRCRLRSYCR